MTESEFFELSNRQQELIDRLRRGEATVEEIAELDAEYRRLLYGDRHAK